MPRPSGTLLRKIQTHFHAQLEKVSLILLRQFFFFFNKMERPSLADRFVLILSMIDKDIQILFIF